MDAAVFGDIARESTAVLAPFLARVPGPLEAVGAEAGVTIVSRLWSLLSGYQRVARVAEDPGERWFRERLSAEITRVLVADTDLAAEVADLLARAEAAGVPVAGRSLVGRIRAGARMPTARVGAQRESR
jgi:hypothetical protein